MLTVALITSLFAIVPGIVNAAPVTDVVISAGRTGAFFNLQSSNPTRGLLEDTSLFGPTGTIATVDSITIKPDVEIVNTPYLDDVDIFFDAWTYDVGAGQGTPQWAQEEVDELVEWVNAGGVLILNDDTSVADDLAAAFGVPLKGDNFDPNNVSAQLGGPSMSRWTQPSGARSALSARRTRSSPGPLALGRS